MNKHKLRTQQKYQDILKATIGLIAHTPLEHITIEKIKQKARVSQVTIYKLFDTKDSLIIAALKYKSAEAVGLMTDALKSECSAHQRLDNYFRTSFGIALSFPRQKDIIEYVFSGINEDLKAYVVSLYESTYFYLDKLYSEARADALIREEISLEQFLKMCDMYTRITPEFFQVKEEMDIIVKSIIRSFG